MIFSYSKVLYTTVPGYRNVMQLRNVFVFPQVSGLILWPVCFCRGLKCCQARWYRHCPILPSCIFPLHLFQFYTPFHNRTKLKDRAAPASYSSSVTWPQTITFLQQPTSNNLSLLQLITSFCFGTGHASESKFGHPLQSCSARPRLTQSRYLRKQLNIFSQVPCYSVEAWIIRNP